MSLFGSYKVKSQPAGTLTQMIDKLFNDCDLKNELRLYLKSRREQRNVPSKTSWEMQLNLLAKVPENQRVAQVHTATLKGWRSVAFENTYKSKKSYNNGVERVKQANTKIMSEGF